MDFADLVAARRRAALERLAALEADLTAARAARTDSASGDDEHDPEGATAADDLSRLAGLRRQAITEVAELDRASERLAGGTYGICESCGNPIPEGRLEALPQATLCVACASRVR